MCTKQKPHGKALTSAPRLGRGLVAGLLADSVRLPLVLGHARVDVLDDVGTDGRAEDLRKDFGGAGGLAIGADDGHGRAGGHLVQMLRHRLSVSRRELRISGSRELHRLWWRRKSRRATCLPRRWATCWMLRKVEAGVQLQLKFCNISKCARGVLAASTDPNRR